MTHDAIDSVRSRSRHPVVSVSNFPARYYRVRLVPQH
jgi:hypothetical protein